MSGVNLFLRAMLARAYPRIIGMRRQPSWVIHETILPLLSVAAYAGAYGAMDAGREFVGYVILGGAMTAFWLNVLWSMGAQLYWERSSGNLEIYIMAPCPMMSVLAGMALGGMALTCVRAGVIFAAGILIFQIPFVPINWPLLIAVFLLMLLALYGLGMVFASAFLLWGREAWHIVNLLQEPVYLLSGQNFPVRILGSVVATGAAVLPLTTGMDALRQLLFPNTDGLKLLDVGWEVAILAFQAVAFLAWAQRSLKYLERRAREEGRLTVRWQ